MNVLLATRIISKSMGSERVFILTKKWLRRLGVNVEAWTPDDDHFLEALEWADIIHWFNHGGPKEDWKAKLLAAREKGKPIVATATYWPLTQGELLSGIYVLGLSPEDAAGIVQARLELDRELAGVLELADVVIATSKSELNMINGMMSYWNRQVKRFAIIPNVIELEELPSNVPAWEKRPKQLIQIGRIETAKNQPRVLAAFRHIKRRYPDAMLILVGRSDGVLERKYESLFKQNGVSVVGEVDFEVVSQIMINSRGHILPSFRDTPGLVSLEAATVGCNIVVSEGFGTPGDYFRDLALYVNPLSEVSIEGGMEQALSEPPDPRLQQLVCSFFTYEKVVPGLIKLYTMALKGLEENNGS